MDIFDVTLKESREKEFYCHKCVIKSDEGWGCEYSIFHVNNVDSWLVSRARTNTVTVAEKEHLELFGSQDITSLTQFSGCEFCAG